MARFYPFVNLPWLVIPSATEFQPARVNGAALGADSPASLRSFHGAIAIRPAPSQNLLIVFRTISGHLVVFPLRSRNCPDLFWIFFAPFQHSIGCTVLRNVRDLWSDARRVAPTEFVGLGEGCRVKRRISLSSREQHRYHGQDGLEEAWCLLHSSCAGCGVSMEREAPPTLRRIVGMSPAFLHGPCGIGKSYTSARLFFALPSSFA